MNWFKKLFGKKESNIKNRSLYSICSDFLDTIDSKIDEIDNKFTPDELETIKRYQEKGITTNESSVRDKDVKLRKKLELTKFANDYYKSKYSSDCIFISHEDMREFIGDNHYLLPSHKNIPSFDYTSFSDIVDYLEFDDCDEFYSCCTRSYISYESDRIIDYLKGDIDIKPYNSFSNRIIRVNRHGHNVDSLEYLKNSKNHKNLNGRFYSTEDSYEQMGYVISFTVNKKGIDTYSILKPTAIYTNNHKKCIGNKLVGFLILKSSDDKAFTYGRISKIKNFLENEQEES